MKKICHICVSLLVLSLFISCETPTSSTTSKAAAISSIASTQNTTETSSKSTKTTESTTETQVEKSSIETAGSTATETTDNLFDKVKGQTYFGIRTWSEDEAEKLVEANGTDSDDYCDELADRRLALVFSNDGQKAGFADEDDETSAKNKAKSNQDYTVTQDGNKITLTKDSKKLVLGIHDNGKFLYILEDSTQKPQEVTNVGFDYKYTGLAKNGEEKPKTNTAKKDKCPVEPEIPECPNSLKI